MPEEEGITKSLQEKRKESFFKQIKPNWILAGLVGMVFLMWMYSSSSQFQAFITQNALFIGFGVGVILYVFYKGQTSESVIGLVRSQMIAKNFITYQQRTDTIPKGKIIIEQDKRRHVGKDPKSYYHVATVHASDGLHTYIVGVDSKTGDVTLREPVMGGVVRISEEMRDIEPKKRIITGEEEIEEV